MGKIKTGTPSENETTLFSLKATYLQESDTCSDKGDINELKVTSENVGDGDYFVIETKRWAFDEIDELIEVMQDFKDRLENNK